MKKICLVMIVKDEAAIIRRCLDSVRGFISYWVICDTGSTDGTEEVIREALAGVPGELYQDEWVDFGYNRTLSMERAAGKGDYHLLLDADMTLEVEEELGERLEGDAYFLPFAGVNDYAVLRLVSDRHAWKYRGVTHEHVYSETAGPGWRLPGVRVVHHEDGSSRGEKYERDIRMLERALEEEPGNARYVFYLAQSYRDVGNHAKAYEYYFQRAGMGGWDEEVWYSLYQVARMQELMGAAWPVCLAGYLQAFQFRPSRLEPIYHVASFYRRHGQHTLALLFARLCLEVGYPEDVLFIERDIYEQGLPTEFALACEGLGRKEEFAEICRAAGEGVAMGKRNKSEVEVLQEHSGLT